MNSLKEIKITTFLPLKMILPSVWSVSLCLWWRIWLVWKPFLSICSGVSWSAPVKQTQITAWWVWTQSRETDLDYFCSCPHLYHTLQGCLPLEILYFNFNKVLHCVSFFRLAEALLWCVPVNCRVWHGSITAVRIQLILQFTPRCVTTLTGLKKWWPCILPWLQLLPLGRHRRLEV